MSEKKLYIFDLDNTLVEKWGVTPLPGVLMHLTTLEQNGCAIAIATNQAGIAWGALTKREQFPTPASLGARCIEIAQLLPPLQHAHWFIAIHDARVRLSARRYTTLVAATEQTGEPLTLHVAAVPDWRKPQPGMLITACERYNVTEDEAIFIGDMDADAEAAQTAGMDFVSAEEFFKTGESS